MSRTYSYPGMPSIPKRAALAVQDWQRSQRNADKYRRELRRASERVSLIQPMVPA
jgi:hypothetical protein